MADERPSNETNLQAFLNLADDRFHALEQEAINLKFMVRRAVRGEQPVQPFASGATTYPAEIAERVEKLLTLAEEFRSWFHEQGSALPAGAFASRPDRDLH